MKIRIGLTPKILILISLFITLLSISIYLTVSEQIISGSIEVTTENINDFVNDLSNKIEENHLLEDVVTLNLLLAEQKNLYPDIDKINIVRRDIILVSSTIGEFNRQIGSNEEGGGELLELVENTGIPEGRVEDREDITPRYTYVYPFSGGTPENRVLLVLKYSLEKEFHAIEHAKDGLRKNILLSVLIFFPIILIAFHFFLLLPLKKITNASASLGSGRFNTEITIKTGDELEKVADTFNRMAEQIRARYERYLSPQVVERLSRDPEAFDRGGRKVTASVMFCDLAGFTSFSQNLEPDKISGFLNYYFKELTSIIFSNEGTLDKYLGDGIMAVFGAPMPVEDFADKALEAARQMHQCFEENVEKWIAANEIDMKEQLSIRIGISTGEVFSGNIGYDKRSDFTVIGSTVNLAARLEHENKIQKTKILIDESTYRLVSKEQQLKLEAREPVNIRGFDRKIEVFGVKV